MLTMKKLFSWTGTDEKNQTLDTQQTRSSDNLFNDDLNRWLQTPPSQSPVADFQSALPALTPATYAAASVQRPLPSRHRRIPIIFLGPLPEEREEPVQIQVDPVTFAGDLSPKTHC